MTSVAEVERRVALLEERLSALSVTFAEKLADSLNDRRKLHEALSSVQQSIDSQKTFVAGVAFTLSAIGATAAALFTMFKDWILAHIFK